MNSHQDRNDRDALNAILDGYEAPAARAELQQAILADYDKVRLKRPRQANWREVFGYFLAPAGAFSALSVAGFVLGVVSVETSVTAQEYEALAYLSEAYESALLGAAADGEESEIWQEF